MNPITTVEEYVDAHNTLEGYKIAHSFHHLNDEGIKAMARLMLELQSSPFVSTDEGDVYSKEEWDLLTCDWSEFCQRLNLKEKE